MSDNEIPPNQRFNPWENSPSSDSTKKKPDRPNEPQSPLDLDSLLGAVKTWLNNAHKKGSQGHGNNGGAGGNNAPNGSAGRGMPPMPKQAFASLAFFAALFFTGLWLTSGFYQVATDEAGVVMRFGAFERVDPPGLRWHLPRPFEVSLTPVVTAQNTIAVGFKAVRANSSQEEGALVPEESLMLTQDENVIDVQFTVFWRIGDVRKYLFEIRDPKATIKAAAESVMRDVIGQNKLEFALTDGRAQIAEEARLRLQKIMDEYNVGVVITQINLQGVSVPEEVKAAFQDVVNARLDQERFQNQAAAHVNKVIPEARGKAAQVIQEARAYRDQKIAVSQGSTQRFRDVASVWANAKEVTEQRLYFEAMESVLRSANKIILDPSVSTTASGGNAGSGTGVVSILPLGDLIAQTAAKRAQDNAADE